MADGDLPRAVEVAASAEGSCTAAHWRVAPSEVSTGETVSSWKGSTPTATWPAWAESTRPPSVGTATGVRFCTVRQPSSVPRTIQRTPLGHTAKPLPTPVITT